MNVFLIPGLTLLRAVQVLRYYQEHVPHNWRRNRFECGPDRRLGNRHKSGPHAFPESPGGVGRLLQQITLLAFFIR